MVLVLGVAFWCGIAFQSSVAIFGLLKWQGRWRGAAAVPLIALGLFCAPLLPDLGQDPVGGNLWGLLFVPVSSLLGLYCSVLWLLRRRNVDGSGRASDLEQ
jgi:hypothetical protein